jgi:hypothetical protein
MIRRSPFRHLKARVPVLPRVPLPQREIDEIEGQLPLNDQLGLEWAGDNGERYRTQYAGSLNPKTRVVEAKITTWVGSMAIGAMHWDAHIEPDSPDIVDLNDPRGGTHSGFVGKAAPRIERRRLKIERLLTKVERDMNREIIGKKGEYTGRYNDPKTPFFDMMRALKEKFGAGWIVRLEMEDGGNAKFPIEEIEATEEFYTKARAKCQEVFS